VTLEDKIKIIYFLEDRAQDGFIKAIVERIAKEESIPTSSLITDIRSSKRGGSRCVKEFKVFIKDSEKTGTENVDFLVVAIDGNRKGYRDRIRELEKHIKPDHPFKNRVIYAVPDPHIERWYITDQRAFKDGVKIDKAPDLPPYKPKKDYYKQVINRALKDSGVDSSLGGAEYAERIVEKIDLDLLGKQNAGFQTFIEDLRRAFRQMRRE
jgi:hypothetical protein